MCLISSKRLSFKECDGMKIRKEFKANIKNTIIICNLLALLVAVSIIIAVGQGIKNNKLYTYNVGYF